MLNTKSLRCAIGWLGIALPWIVLLLSCFAGYGLPDSISATYYLPTCITPFMIILGVAGILLLFYYGYDKQDRIVCSITGLLAFGICLFPCKVAGLIPKWGEIVNLAQVGTFQLPPWVSGLLHNTCALGFFALLAYNSFFLFTKTNGQMSDKKKKRNKIFRICGVGMAISFLAIIPVSIFKIWGGVWFIETIALSFFGISWLTKANKYKWLFAE